MKVHGYFVHDGAGIAVKASGEFREGAWEERKGRRQEKREQMRMNSITEYRNVSDRKNFTHIEANGNVLACSYQGSLPRI